MTEQEGNFIAHAFAWCWEVGIDVELTRVVFARYDGPPVVQPQLKFKKGEKHTALIAYDFNELMSMFKFSHKKIAMDLAVPEFKMPGQP